MGGDTRYTFAYTNHTLLPEALEKWTVDLFGSLLPRHLEIVFEINRRFLDEVRAAFPGDDARLSRLSLIDESGPHYVRMAHLACVGSHTINGVAQLHSELLKQTVLRDFAELWPGKFCNVTNGDTPRRFVAVSNPSLTQLVTTRIGDGWLQDPHRLRALEPLADDAEFQRQWRDVKLANKRRLGALIAERTGIAVVPEALFDVMLKRIHEYKRQHLNALHILTLYLQLKRDPQADVRPHLHLRRQGRARLFHGQAHHQAHHRHRRPGEQRPGRARPVEGRLLPQLQREERALHLSRRRFVRANLHHRQGSERHRQHEVLAQRGAYHRYARRCECRNPRGSRRGEFLPLRPYRRRSRSGEDVWVSPARQSAIHRTLAARQLQDGHLVLYDITSSYFEGAYTQSDIVAFGYDRDGKRGHEQMVIALLCSGEGCPVGVEVFAGNTQDASTVPEKIAQLQRQYGLKEIIFVGDRGMITKTVAHKNKGIEGLHTISALTHRQIVELLERKVIAAELFDEGQIVQVFDPEEPKRRYCLCRNPQTAGRKGKTRERLLERTRAEFDKIAGSKRRANAKTLGARVGRVLERSKMGKFVRWDVLDGRLSWSFDQDKIVAEKLFDGSYIVSGEVPKEDGC